jgi:predicted DNA-binding protein
MAKTKRSRQNPPHRVTIPITLTLSAKHLDSLDDIKDRTGIPKSVIVREILDKHLEEPIMKRRRRS